MTTRHFHSVTLVEVDKGLDQPGLEGKVQELLGLVQVNKLSGLLVLMEARRIQQEGKPS